MMPLMVLLYFFGACGIAAWFLLPSFRSSASRRVEALKSWFGRRPPTTQWVPRTPPVGKALASPPTPQPKRPEQHWRTAVVLIAMGLLAVPPVLVWWARSGESLSGFDDHAEPIERSESGVVTALLQGEQLVPPPPVPPDLFLTREVETVRPQLSSADRRWDQLTPNFRQRLLWVYQVMKEEHGYEMVLLEGYRSPQRQDMLSKLGSNVTNAGAWQSFHQYGLAADSAFLRGGKLVISERDPWAARGYALYGEVAVRAGLVWGGKWQNADLGHVELRAIRLGRQ
jgi:peptidoglycan L-alanyl-D-glutamate endopeptidase CwlK